MVEMNIDPKQAVTLDVHALCVQPIGYTAAAFTDIMGRKIDLGRVAAFSVPHVSALHGGQTDWLSSYDAANSAIRSVFIIDGGAPVDPALLKSDIAARCSGDKALLMADRLRVATVSSRLVFDVRFAYFLLVQEFVFAFADMDELSRFAVFDAGAAPKDDAYNQLRALLVSDGANPDQPGNTLGAWAARCREQALSQAARMLATCVGISDPAGALVIYPSTGNMSFFATGFATDGDRQAACDQLIALNRHAESTTKAVEPVRISDGTTYLFSGRFHTAILKQTANFKRMKLVQFHMQYVWFYLNRLQEQVERINHIFIDASASAEVRHASHAIEPLVMKIEMMTIHNERFKSQIEAEAESFYQHAQGRWNIAGALAASQHFISFLRQHLAAVAAERQAVIGRRVNAMLLFISVLQIFGLVSVWADYVFQLKNETVLGGMVGGEQTLQNINLLLPLGLVSLLAIVGVLVMGTRTTRK